MAASGGCAAACDSYNLPDAAGPWQASVVRNVAVSVSRCIGGGLLAAAA